MLGLRFSFLEESKVQIVGAGQGGTGWDGVGVHPEASSECFIDFQAEFGKKVHLNSQFPGTERLPNTCNFSIRGPQLQGDDRLLVSPVPRLAGTGRGDVGSGVSSRPVLGRGPWLCSTVLGPPKALGEGRQASSAQAGWAARVGSFLRVRSRGSQR